MELRYVLNQYAKNFAFNDREYVIRFGGIKKVYDVLSDDEVIEFVSDSLTHEHIHKVIFDLFENSSLCKLFDVIQQYFRDTKLVRKIFKESEYTTWDKFIEKFGFDEFLEGYHITRELLYEAFEVCDRRW